MPTQPGFDLLRLAPELIANIVKQVNKKTDLSHVRLACRLLNEHAVKELFRLVSVCPSEEHIGSWNRISLDDTIRQMPRHAIIDTHPDIDNHGSCTTRETIHVDEDDDEAVDFDDALAALARFPNLDSLEIGFTRECVGPDADFWLEVEQDVSDREEQLTLVFEAIRDRAVDEHNRTIRKLTIINLQNCPLPEFTSSDLFRNVMAHLEELHITTVQEYNEHGPDHDYNKIELQTFPAYLCSHWLKPVAENLKALSLYSESENWGPFPGYFDPSGISFPNLETLALGYYMVAHDNDLDWLLAIKSLRKLIFHNCMIASWIYIDTDNMRRWKVRAQDWTRLSDPDQHEQSGGFAYSGKWSQHFDRIAQDLPNLVDFRFGYGDPYHEPQYKITNRNDCPVGIFHQRYICFDNGILPTHWLESRDGSEGELHAWLVKGFPSDVHKENYLIDQQSLDSLLQIITLRRNCNV
ncbi:hypothetical protein ACET3X_007072 [Alternaria dauci]|uniref:F-box domain-containing protein n=1 Tax=Alternaria dauci TaxID=48095 RepID=A0ABR3UFK1_9PLEO